MYVFRITVCILKSYFNWRVIFFTLNVNCFMQSLPGGIKIFYKLNQSAFKVKCFFFTAVTNIFNFYCDIFIKICKLTHSFGKSIKLKLGNFKYFFVREKCCGGSCIVFLCLTNFFYGFLRNAFFVFLKINFPVSFNFNLSPFRQSIYNRDANTM